MSISSRCAAARVGSHTLTEALAELCPRRGTTSSQRWGLDKVEVTSSGSLVLDSAIRTLLHVGRLNVQRSNVQRLWNGDQRIKRPTRRARARALVRSYPS